MAAPLINNFSRVITGFNDLSVAQEGLKPCFFDDRITWGYANPVARSVAQAGSKLIGWTGMVETYDRSLEPLTQFVNNLTAYFRSDEFQILSKDQYIELAAKTRTAIRGLQILNQQYAQSGKSQIVDCAIAQIAECTDIAEEAITLKNVDESLAHTVDIFHTMVDRRGADQLCELQEQVRSLVQENIDLKDLNRHLIEEIKSLRSENQKLKHEISSEGSRTFAELSSVLSPFMPTATCPPVSLEGTQQEDKTTSSDFNVKARSRSADPLKNPQHRL